MVIQFIGIGSTPPADALDFWSQQKHQYHNAQDLWLHLPRKLTSSGFSPSVGFWQRDAE